MVGDRRDPGEQPRPRRRGRRLRGEQAVADSGDAEQGAAAERDEQGGELRPHGSGGGGDAGTGGVRLGGQHGPGQERDNRHEHRGGPVEGLRQ